MVATSLSYPKVSKGGGAYLETRIVATLRGDLAAVLVERGDGTCTVIRAGVWRTFSGEPEEWPNRRQAMRAVEVATGEPVDWSEMAHTRGRTELRNHERRAIEQSIWALPVAVEAGGGSDVCASVAQRSSNDGCKRSQCGSH